MQFRTKDDRKRLLGAEMPRFFFDIEDRRHVVVDDGGIELPSVGEARLQAIQALGELAREELSEVPERQFRIIVRDDQQTLFEAALAFTSHRT